MLMYSAPFNTCEYTTYAMIAWYSRARSSLRSAASCSRSSVLSPFVVSVLTIGPSRAFGGARGTAAVNAKRTCRVPSNRVPRRTGTCQRLEQARVCTKGPIQWNAIEAAGLPGHRVLELAMYDDV